MYHIISHAHVLNHNPLRKWIGRGMGDKMIVRIYSNKIKLLFFRLLIWLKWRKIKINGKFIIRMKRINIEDELLAFFSLFCYLLIFFHPQLKKMFSFFSYVIMAMNEMDFECSIYEFYFLWFHDDKLVK